MFVGKYLLYEVQCVRHEHPTSPQRIYCSELRLILIIYSFCIYALLVFILFQNQRKISNKSHSYIHFPYFFKNLVPIAEWTEKDLVDIDKLAEKIWWKVWLLYPDMNIVFALFFI